MSNYDLDETAKLKGDNFTFKLGGKIYKFKYPTVEQAEELGKLTDSEGEIDMEAVTNKMYSFIEPVDDDAPPIGDALKKVTAPVLKEFNRMVTTELGVE